jgi:hypothetical protein
MPEIERSNIELLKPVSDTTDPVDMTTEVSDDTILANILTETGDTSDYDRRTDSLEAISDALLEAIGTVEHVAYRTEDEYALKNTNLDVMGVDAIAGPIYDLRFGVYLELDAAATYTPTIKKTEQLNPTTFVNQTIPALATIATPAAAGWYWYEAGDIGQGEQCKFNLAQDNAGDTNHDIVMVMTYKQ